MLVDLRRYTIVPGQLKAYLAVYETYGLPVQRRHVGDPLGYFVSEVGMLNQVVHLWGFDGMGDFEARHAARDKDPDWPAYLQASTHLITAQENRLIRRVDLPSLAGGT